MAVSFALGGSWLGRTLALVTFLPSIVSGSALPPVTQTRKTAPKTRPGTNANQEERLKRLLESPDDQELWTDELKRQQDEGIALEERRLGAFVLSQGKVPASNDPSLNLAIAANRQRQGIALRHLKRYQDALGQFSESHEVLAAMEGNQHCDVRSSAELCLAIREQYHMINSYVAYVYVDLKDDATAKRYSDLALQFAADAKEYCSHVYSMVHLYTSRGQYDPASELALNSFEKALASGDKDEIDGTSDIFLTLYRDLFKSISWVPETGAIRRNDPQGFADAHGIGVDRPYRYGMASPEEDKATFIALLFTDSEIKKRSKSDQTDKTLANPNRDIEGYVRSQLAKNNFEFPAKYVFFKYVTSAFHLDGTQLQCRASDMTNVPFNEVMAKLAAAPRSQVDENTRLVIQLFYRAYTRLSARCLPD